MAMDMSQIRQMNHDFYNSETYCMYAGTRNKWFVFLLIIFSAIVAIIMNQVCVLGKFIEKAGQQETGGMEVMDWAWQETMKQLFSIPTLLILLCLVCMGIYVYIMFYKVKSYDLYKYRWWISVIPALIFGIFYGVSVLILFLQGSVNLSLVFIQIINVIPMVLSGRSFVPL